MGNGGSKGTAAIRQGTTQMAARRGWRQQGDGGNPSRRHDADGGSKGTATRRGRRQQGDGGNKGRRQQGLAPGNRTVGLNQHVAS